MSGRRLRYRRPAAPSRCPTCEALEARAAALARICSGLLEARERSPETDAERRLRAEFDALTIDKPDRAEPRRDRPHPEDR